MSFLRNLFANLKTRSVLTLGLGLLAIAFLLLSGKLVENVDNSEIVIIQSPFTGKVTIYAAPGPVMQSFGTATHYRKSHQFWFSKKNDEGVDEDQSIKIRFNDGGHGQISGSVRWYMPSASRLAFMAGLRTSSSHVAMAGDRDQEPSSPL